MPNELRKMAFWEIAKGDFAKQFQKDFERAQDLANKRGLVVNVSSTITIYPEKKDTPGHGGVEFQTSIKEPPKKSMRHVTLLKNGRMIKDGLSINEVMQLDLDLPDVKKEAFVPDKARYKIVSEPGQVEMPPPEIAMIKYDPKKHSKLPSGEIVDIATGEVIG